MTNDRQTCAENRREALLARRRWLAFVLPFVVYMLAGSLEPTPGARSLGWSVPYAYYPLVYGLKIALTAGAILFVWPAYREFPFRVSPWAVAAGVAGVVVWVGLCRLDLEHRVLGRLGLGGFFDLGERPGYDPLRELGGSPALAWGFLGLRLFGLAVVVPVMEEFFLRGFVMRWVMRPDWWNVSVGQVNAAAVAVGTLLPMTTHPAELVAAAVWFSMITVLMVKTRNLWDCVAAHTLTNLLLGIYIAAFGQWRLL